MAAVLTVERLQQFRCTVDDGGLVAEVGHTVDPAVHAHDADMVKVCHRGDRAQAIDRADLGRFIGVRDADVAADLTGVEQLAVDPGRLAGCIDQVSRRLHRKICCDRRRACGQLQAHGLELLFHIGHWNRLLSQAV